MHALALEAGWVAKYAGLDDEDAIKLISSNVESILGLPKTTDMVLWEGSPLQFGGTVALTFREDAEDRIHLAECWPQELDS